MEVTRQAGGEVGVWNQDLERLVRSAASRYSALVGSILRAGYDYDDVLQELRVAVLCKIGISAGKASLSTRVYRICFCELVNLLRREGRRRQLLQTVPLEEAIGLRSGDDPEGEVLDREYFRWLAGEVQRFLRSRYPAEADGILRHLLEGVPINRCGVPSSRAWRILQACRQHLERGYGFR